MYISFFLHHGPQGSEDDPELVLTHTKQLLLVTFCDTTPGIGAMIWTHAQMKGTAD